MAAASRSISLRAIATPIETPTPVSLPAPTATEAATIVAEMLEVLRESRVTLPAARTVSGLLSMWALVLLRMALKATAPAPLMARPVFPTPTPMAAAAETALIEFPETVSRPLTFPST